MATSSRNTKLPTSSRNVVHFIVTGLLGIAIPNSNMYFAARHLPAGILAVIVNIVPLLIYPMSIALGEEKIYRLRIIGILLGVLGVMLVVVPSLRSPHNSIFPWALIALISPLCFASCAVFGSKYRVMSSSLVLSAGMMFAAAIILTPVVWATDQGFMLSSHHFAGSVAVLIEIVLSSIGYVLFFELLKTAGPVFYSLVAGIVSITGLFWGWMVFGERIGVLTVFAVMLILIALYLVSRKMSAYTRAS